MADRWANIPLGPNPGVHSVKRADPRHPLPFYWGRDFLGRYLFTLEGSARRDRLEKPPYLAGIESSIIDLGGGNLRIVLALTDPAERDVFQALCSDLMWSTKEHQPSDTESAMLAVIARLMKWHHLLKKRRDDLLTRQEVVGLIGELFFLRDVVLSHLSPLGALNSWRGPCGDEQDFVVGRTILEVKTQTNTADRRIQISSADQLDTTSGEILLVSQLIASAVPEDNRSRSLNSLVQEIASLIEADAEASDVFQARLVEAGYILRGEYDEISWILTDRSAFRIDRGFPRIVAADLMQGIGNVRYTIEFDALSEFRVPTEDLAKYIFDGRR